ncbi:hypothetical protein HYV49_04055 [Candidatus Pacearchaeota archaeon]|nr:hypothetical protein [Candidatus Pacearchaeota archaeon]
MTKEIRYGVISDVHEDPRIVTRAIHELKTQGAEKLLVNGDIGGWKGNLQASQDYTAFILNEVAKSGLEAFVQAGSHEPLLVFGPVVEYLSNKFKGQIIDVTKVPKVEYNGHHLVFLPGSDFLVRGGEYQIGSNEQIPTGKYIQTESGLLTFNIWQEFISIMQRGISQGAMYYSNMYDLKKYVNQPEKTIVVCHIPRKFQNLSEAVDVAEFGEAIIDFPLQGNIIENGSVFPIHVAKKIHEAGYPIAIKKENRGNEDLKKLYDELGITKSVSGHFHESSHRANDRDGSHVNEGEYVTELFWNSGHLDAGHTGILTVNGEQVSYRNIKLEI